MSTTHTPRHRTTRPASAWAAPPVSAGPGDALVRVLLIPFVLLAAGALVAAGLFPILGGAGNAVKQFSGQFLDLKDGSVKIGTFPLRSTFFAANGSRLATVAQFNRTEVPFDQIPPMVRDAVLAIEDHGYYQHGAVDPPAIVRAFLQNAASGHVVSGASTITQQLVKNTIVGNQETLQRKIEEAQYSILLQREYTKDQILEAYLNEIYLGHGTYGIGAAAEWYFAKRVATLTLPQAALLAGMISSPEHWDPVDARPLALARRNQVLAAMLKYGYIDRAAYDDALATPITLRSKERDVNRPGPEPYFVGYVQDQILNPLPSAPWYKQFLRVFGSTYAEREKALFQGGLSIYTTVQPRLQQAAVAAVNNRIPDPGLRPPTANPEAALATVVPKTGAIVAMYGGPDFRKHPINLAAQTRRQAGSAFKAFTLVGALEQGIPVGKVYDTPNPVDIPESKCPNPGGDWKPANAEPGGGAFLDMATATKDSVNVYFAQLIADAGPMAVQKAAEDMGVQAYMSPAKVQVRVDPICAITLGSVEVNPLTMTTAYSTLANGGKHCYPFAISKIVAPNGKLLYKAKPSCTQVVDPNIAATVTHLLEGVILGGTGSAAYIGRPAAGKTGTAQNYTDAWFMGYVPQLTTGVWVGYGYVPGEITINGAPVLHGAHAFGGTLAAPIWHDFMAAATKGMPVLDFPVPPPPKGGVVPNVVGMRQDDAVNTLAKANFTAEVQTGPSDQPAGIVFQQSPGGGASAQLGTRVTIWVSNGVSPNKPVPGVIGLSQEAATSALRAAGFGVAVVYRHTKDPGKVGIVLDQAPAGGRDAKPGSTVTILVGKMGPSPSPPPPSPTPSP